MTTQLTTRQRAKCPPGVDNRDCWRQSTLQLSANKIRQNDALVGRPTSAKRHTLQSATHQQHRYNYSHITMFTSPPEGCELLQSPCLCICNSMSVSVSVLPVLRITSYFHTSGLMDETTETICRHTLRDCAGIRIDR